MAQSFTNWNTIGEKAYAVRAVNGDIGRTPCTACQTAAWNDMCLHTPFSADAGGQFTMPLFQLPPDYAGLTISVDFFDVGDMWSASGSVRMNILDPTGAVATSSQGINIYRLGPQRSNLATHNYTVYASAPGNTIASYLATDIATGVNSAGIWYHLEIPIASTYNPPPGQYWWSMQFVTAPGTVANDALTVAVGLKGGPVHLTS
jgi:hypothetical protein